MIPISLSAARFFTPKKETLTRYRFLQHKKAPDGNYMKVFEMFAGVGGFSQGFPKEWEHVGFSEIDRYASMVLKYHYPHVRNYGDCTKINYDKVPDFDVLTGGSPCQDFSIAGKRRGLSGARSSLAWEYIRCLRDKKPRYFIWENVKGVLSSRGGWDFGNLITAFSESGYALWWQVLNAKDFGVPQNRERIFVIGFRDEHPKEVFFERKSNEINNGESRDKLREQITNTIRTNYSNGFSNETYIEVQNKGASQHYRVYGKDGLAPTLQSQSGMSSQKHPFIVASRGRNPQNPKSCKSGLKTEQMLEPNLTGNSNTLTGVEKDNYVFDGKVRKLMPIENERLMSFPDDWTKWGIDEKRNKLEISDSQRYKMCGNGVVSNVVKEIIKNIL